MGYKAVYKNSHFTQMLEDTFFGDFHSQSIDFRGTLLVIYVKVVWNVNTMTLFV